jgi:hypothetical protein
MAAGMYAYEHVSEGGGEEEDENEDEGEVQGPTGAEEPTALAAAGQEQGQRRLVEGWGEQGWLISSSA